VRKQIDLERSWEAVQARGIQVMTWEDEVYPAHLRTIDHPPPLIYVDGQLTPEDDTAVAVVGTRRPTAYGRRVTQDIALALARGGVTVVSGLARGVDSEAHQETLRSGGRTLAVLGCGLDMIYPPENRRLFETIRRNGALISDYPLGTPPDAVNFPPRNRLVSGLSRLVVVVEAGVQSGAMITASFAADQGKDVFAVPGPITSIQSQGTNLLIQQGARPLLHPEELLDALDIQRVYEQRETRKAIPTDPDESRIIDLLSGEVMHVDDICVQTGLSVDRITATLAIMELKGMVRKEYGMRYRAIREGSAVYWIA
jgi:DNA processing protein